MIIINKRQAKKLITHNIKCGHNKLRRRHSGWWRLRRRRTGRGGGVPGEEGGRGGSGIVSSGRATVSVAETVGGAVGPRGGRGHGAGGGGGGVAPACGPAGANHLMGDEKKIEKESKIQETL